MRSLCSLTSRRYRQFVTETVICLQQDRQISRSSALSSVEIASSSRDVDGQQPSRLVYR